MRGSGPAAGSGGGGGGCSWGGGGLRSALSETQGAPLVKGEREGTHDPLIRYSEKPLLNFDRRHIKYCQHDKGYFLNSTSDIELFQN